MIKERGERREARVARGERTMECGGAPGHERPYCSVVRP